MEATPLPIPSAEDSTEQFAAALRMQRQKVREFLAMQQERLQCAERELSEQLQHIGAELAADRRQTLQAGEELARRSAQLQQQAEAMEEMKTELAARQAEWEKLYRGVIEQQQAFTGQLKLQQDEIALRQQEFLEQQAAAAAAETGLMREKKEIEAGRVKLESRRAEIDALRESLQTRQDDLERRNQELNARTAETESRRRSIARELRAQHAANLKELELKRLALKQEAKADHSELQRQVESLKEECRILRDKFAAAENSMDRAEVERIKAENKEMADHLAVLERQLVETRQGLAGAQNNRGTGDEDDDLNRRYEMSLDDLRELKARNEELQEQLARARQGGGANAGHIRPGVLNWEAEKMRILAALEANFEEENEEDREEKPKIQDVIRKTDRLVEEKNREIGELRGLLESQTNNIGSMAVGAAALGEILDADAIIQEERKNLARLQEECRDKLRQAEVEISLERAKIARERSQLNEKIRILEEQGINLASIAEAKEPEKPPRGRWRARMGLTNSEDEQKK